VPLASGPAARDGRLLPSDGDARAAVDTVDDRLCPWQEGVLERRAVRDRSLCSVTATQASTLLARPTLHVSLACDRRILYGADGARFLDRVAQLLASPLALLL
jgi:pyruvate/2-oxoglutarate dehydrogenase complex dihydrolipoamide acyltransferase (E2) component